MAAVLDDIERRVDADRAQTAQRLLRVYGRHDTVELAVDQVHGRVDALVVAEVYPAGEAPIPGADGKALCRAIRSRGSVEPILLRSLDQLPGVLAGIVRDGDVVLTMGAGSIGAAAHDLPASLPAAGTAGGAA